MEFTDRMMATDRAVSSYLRFAGDPTPPPSEAVPEIVADLLHWHERFVIPKPPMSKREVRQFVNEAVKTFYEEREAMARGEEPLKRPRREYSPEEAEARRIIREERDSMLPRATRMRPSPFEVMDEPPTYHPEMDVPLPTTPPYEQLAEMVAAVDDRLTEASTHVPWEEEDTYPAPDPGPNPGRVEF